MSIFILLLALAIWGVVHSFLASHTAKDLFRLKVGSMDFYRLAYNVFSAISFLPILYLMATLPNQLVYEVPSPWNLVMFGGQLLSVDLVCGCLPANGRAFLHWLASTV